MVGWADYRQGQSLGRRDACLPLVYTVSGLGFRIRYTGGQRTSRLDTGYDARTGRTQGPRLRPKGLAPGGKAHAWLPRTLRHTRAAGEARDDHENFHEGASGSDYARSARRTQRMASSYNMLYLICIALSALVFGRQPKNF